MRCKSTYPGSVTLRGKAVRCELRAGHVGEHGHSFAARYWEEAETERRGTLAMLARSGGIRPSITGGVKVA